MPGCASFFFFFAPPIYKDMVLLCFLRENGAREGPFPQIGGGAACRRRAGAGGKRRAPFGPSGAPSFPSGRARARQLQAIGTVVFCAFETAPEGLVSRTAIGQIYA